MYEEFGTTVYPMSDPISSAALEDIENLAGSFFPTQHINLPYRSAYGELPKGTSVATMYYFYIKNSTNIYINNEVRVNGNNGKHATIRVSLYRERSSLAGSNAWEKCESQDLICNGSFKTTTTFTDLDKNYVYCVVFENASDFDCTVSGTFEINDTKQKIAI